MLTKSCLSQIAYNIITKHLRLQVIEFWTQLTPQRETPNGFTGLYLELPDTCILLWQCCKSLNSIYFMCDKVVNFLRMSSQLKGIAAINCNRKHHI